MLLLLLKIIGIIILSILGIFLLFILLLIFTPIRYELKGECTGNLDSLDFNAKLSFFIRLITVRIQYHENQLVWKVRLAWKKITSESDSAEKKSDTLFSAEQPEKKATAVSVKKVSESSINKDFTHNAKGTSSQEQKTNTGFTEKIETLIKKIKCTFTKICAMINALKEKTDEITAFLSNETHKAAFQKLLSEIRKLFKKLKPKKWDGVITFGFDDPSVTGKVLGGISILYPYIQDNLIVNADFDKKMLSGNLDVKGRIRLSIFLSFLLHLIVNKNVRVTISHILKLIKKFKQGGH